MGTKCTHRKLKGSVKVVRWVEKPDKRDTERIESAVCRDCGETFEYTVYPYYLADLFSIKK